MKVLTYVSNKAFAVRDRKTLIINRPLLDTYGGRKVFMGYRK